MRWRHQFRISLATTSVLHRLRLLLLLTVACRAAGSPAWARKDGRLNTFYALKYFYNLGQVPCYHVGADYDYYTLTNSAEIQAVFPETYARMMVVLKGVELGDSLIRYELKALAIKAQHISRLSS